MAKVKYSPCAKDCSERSATCHAHCQKYAEYRERNDEERNARNKAIAIACDIYTAKKERFWKEVRRGRRKAN